MNLHHYQWYIHTYCLEPKIIFRMLKYWEYWISGLKFFDLCLLSSLYYCIQYRFTCDDAFHFTMKPVGFMWIRVLINVIFDGLINKCTINIVHKKYKYIKKVLFMVFCLVVVSEIMLCQDFVHVHSNSVITTSVYMTPCL